MLRTCLECYGTTTNWVVSITAVAVGIWLVLREFKVKKG